MLPHRRGRSLASWSNDEGCYAEIRDSDEYFLCLKRATVMQTMCICVSTGHGVQILSRSCVVRIFLASVQTCLLKLGDAQIRPRVFEGWCRTYCTQSVPVPSSFVCAHCPFSLCVVSILVWMSDGSRIRALKKERSHTYHLKGCRCGWSVSVCGEWVSVGGVGWSGVGWGVVLPTVVVVVLTCPSHTHASVPDELCACTSERRVHECTPSSASLTSRNPMPDALGRVLPFSPLQSEDNSCPPDRAPLEGPGRNHVLRFGVGLASLSTVSVIAVLRLRRLRGMTQGSSAPSRRG